MRIRTRQDANSTVNPQPEDTHTHSAGRSDEPREYDRTGFYHPEGRSFRIWALLAWLAGVVVFLAVVSAGLNYLLLA